MVIAFSFVEEKLQNQWLKITIEQWLLNLPWHITLYANVWCKSDPPCRTTFILCWSSLPSHTTTMATRGLIFVQHRAPRAASLSERDVDEHKDLIGDLYLSQNQTREQVIQHLKTTFEFSISWVQSFPTFPSQNPMLKCIAGISSQEQRDGGGFRSKVVEATLSNYHQVRQLVNARRTTLPETSLSARPI